LVDSVQTVTVDTGYPTVLDRKSLGSGSSGGPVWTVGADGSADIVGLGQGGDDLPLSGCQQPLRFGQGQTQTGNVAEIIGPVLFMTSVHAPSPSAPVFTSLNIQATHSPSVRERSQNTQLAGAPNLVTVPHMRYALRYSVVAD
jgi:hypothetical protein